MRAAPSIKARQFNIKTALGDAIGDIVNIAAHRQVNIYLPPNGGAALFAVFPNYMDDDEIRASLVPVLEGPGLLPNQDITDQIADALAAGTAGIPAVSAVRQDEAKGATVGNAAAFGVPTVTHADAAP